ncbi:MAG: hypothetical protein K6F34_06985, partial [Lachnospiraceae bacterium]|nr:hypothetical protein [Lachnospiraceae bacterium]
MIGRKLLTRLTRLGLATYAMTWCMSFTVCAAEHPIADMAVAGNGAIMVAAENDDTEIPVEQEIPDTPVGEEIEIEQEEEIPVEVLDVDVTSDEEVQEAEVETEVADETVIEEDPETELLGASVANAIYFNPGSVTIDLDNNESAQYAEVQFIIYGKGGNSEAVVGPDYSEVNFTVGYYEDANMTNEITASGILERSNVSCDYFENDRMFYIDAQRAIKPITFYLGVTCNVVGVDPADSFTDSRVCKVVIHKNIEEILLTGSDENQSKRTYNISRVTPEDLK